MLLCDKPWGCFFLTQHILYFYDRHKNWYPRGHAKICNMDLACWWKAEKKLSGEGEFKIVLWGAKVFGYNYCREECDNKMDSLNKYVVLREGVKDTFSSFSCYIPHGLQG